MKNLTFLLAATLLMTSCVSNKKYSELKAQLEQYESAGVAAEYTKKDQKMQIEAAEAQIQEMESEMRALQDKMHEIESQQAVSQFANMTPEQLAAAERKMMEDRHAREMEMHQELTGNEMSQMININTRQLGSMKTSLEGALSYYSEPDLSIIDQRVRLVVAISDKLLFSEDKSRLSAQGETFMNRLSSALLDQDDRPFKIYGVTGATQNENLDLASSKAMLVAKSLNEKGALKQMVTSGAQPCDKAYSKRNSACNRVEIVFEFDFDQIMSAGQLGGGMR